MTSNPYQSVLKSLSSIPEEYLVQVIAYLEKLKNRIDEKEKNRNEILSFAGSWADMKESDFQDFLDKAHSTGDELFGRSVEL